jgi:Domain of unknown function (DUF4861)
MMRLKQYCLLKLLLISAIVSWAQPEAGLQLSNTLNIHRTDELIVLKRDFIENKIGNIANGYLPVVKDQQGNIIPFQCDDLDHDGSWDEFVFLGNLKAKEKVTLLLATIDSSKVAVFGPRAYVRLRKKMADATFGKRLQQETMPVKLAANDFRKNPVPLYQTEGPAWENDRVAFRLYFDVRNAKDIFGKTTSRMVMDSIGLLYDNYHQQAPWGMDILKVGTSLGAGALALQVKTKNDEDSLVRLGGDIPGTVVYRCIANGPLRALIELRYENCMYQQQKFTVIERINIMAGSYGYESLVSMQGDAPLGIATGIVNLKSDKYYSENVSGITMLYTHGKQSENNDNLGMAILTKEKNVFVREMPETGSGITQTYTMLLGANSVFRFYSGWEASDKRFATRDGFKDYLRDEAARWYQPVVVQIERNSKESD